MIDPGVLRPGPGTARRWLREELAGGEYHRSLTQRFFDWIGDLLSRVRDATSGVGGINTVVAVLLLVVVVVGAAVLLSRLRGNAAAPSAVGAVFGETRRTADDHRVLAGQALDGGDWDTAVVESMRALTAGLFERGLLGPDHRDVGATAHEVTARATVLFPDRGTRLDRAARVFDETRYGDRPADEPAARELAALEHDLRSASTRADSARGPVVAVPR